MGLLSLKRAGKEAVQRALGAPIAIDFGSANLKLLQLSGDDQPCVVAAGCIEVPENLRSDVKRRLEFQFESLPKLVSALPVRGRRAVCAIPAPLTFCKHAQFGRQEGMPAEVLADGMLTEQLGRDASTLVRKLIEVPGVDRASGKHEYICLATGREIVEKLMKALRAARLDVVGMHSEYEAALAAFHSLNRRTEDRFDATLYLDVGGGLTQVFIGHGPELVFARSIAVGGITLDECIASGLGVPVSKARAVRLAMHDMTPSAAAAPAPAAARGAGGEDGEGVVLVAEDRRGEGVAPGMSPELSRAPAAPTAPAGASLREPLEILTDEANMCVRYHDAMFPSSRVSNVVFIGGESRHRGLCQHIARGLRLPAKVADPLARIARPGTEQAVGVDLSKPQPGWAVAVGLCHCPTDL